jgi:hypothetical protein
MRGAEWLGDRYRRRRYRMPPRDLGGAVEIECDDVELLVIRLLARTGPHGQFSVTPEGDVFTGVRNGYHYEADHFYVSGLSPVLDAAADVLLARTSGEGGRMYVHTTTRVIERAADKSKLADLVEPGAADRGSERFVSLDQD